MTLFDLSRELNVSIATISRALTRPEIVAPDTRERVLKAVKQFDYRPNEIARSLRNRQTKTIGIIVPDITNWFFGLIVKVVEDVAKDHGYAVLICNADARSRRFVGYGNDAHPYISLGPNRIKADLTIKYLTK
jgi:LacI family transcriptional regulator